MTLSQMPCDYIGLIVSICKLPCSICYLLSNFVSTLEQSTKHCCSRQVTGCKHNGCGCCCWLSWDSLKPSNKNVLEEQVESHTYILPSSMLYRIQSWNNLELSSLRSLALLRDLERLGEMLLLLLKCSPTTSSTLYLLWTRQLFQSLRSVLHFPSPPLPPPLPFHQSTQLCKKLPLTQSHLLSKPS